MAILLNLVKKVVQPHLAKPSSTCLPLNLQILIGVPTDWGRLPTVHVVSLCQ